MIVKVENVKRDGYHYYEAEELNYDCMKMEDVLACNFDTADWLIDDSHNKRLELGTCVIMIHNDQRNKSRLIITTRTVYILNENGKTIDRLL